MPHTSYIVKKNKLLWIPASLAMLYILFTSLFALDFFNTEEALKEQMAAFVVHLIPAIVLLLVLILSWNLPVVGGIIFLLFGLLSIFFFNTYRAVDNFLLISFPIFVTGLLFILFPKQKRQD